MVWFGGVIAGSWFVPKPPTPNLLAVSVSGYAGSSLNYDLYL
jgi:hypothetical protein